MTDEAFQQPSGRQYALVHDAQRATVVQVGGGLREYQVDGFPVLDGYGPDEMAHGGRGQPLMPWPNRLADGRYELNGETLQVALNEPDKHNAIHGLVRWSTWDLLASSPSLVRLGHVLWPQPGYPFTLSLELEYELSDAGLRVTMAARNAGRRPAPYGAGQHPYVRASLEAVDGSVLRLPVQRWLETDERQIPTGRELEVAGTRYDFREPRPIGAARLDTAFAGPIRDGDGLARIELRAAGGGRTVTLWMDRGFEYVMAFTGDTLPEGERRRSLAVEPMTCAPDAFHNGMGLRFLQPGQRTRASWGISVQT